MLNFFSQFFNTQSNLYETHLQKKILCIPLFDFSVLEFGLTLQVIGKTVEYPILKFGLCSTIRHGFGSFFCHFFLITPDRHREHSFTTERDA